jgi:pimeloyl-ACP methyl ester carboxylesterase
MGFLSRLFARHEPGPRLREVLCADSRALHRMRYLEWGDPHNPRVLVCVHGLTRNARDFDALAGAMSPHYRVVCPDVVGRGRSEWLQDPAGYAIPQYVSDMMVLLGRQDVEQVHWVGTSMGGLIGMVIASLQNSPISRLVLNDVGPVIAPCSGSVSTWARRRNSPPMRTPKSTSGWSVPHSVPCPMRNGAN